jgi:hypothetical protein
LLILLFRVGARPRQLKRYVAMGSTFIEIGGKGFWMRDGMLELWLRLLALHLEDPAKDETHVVRKIRDNWLLASRGYFGGHVPVDLEDSVSTPAGRAAVLTAIESLSRALKKGPDKLDDQTLNVLGFEGGVFIDDIERERLLEIADAFLALIAGEIHSDASSTEFMPGCWVAT